MAETLVKEKAAKGLLVHVQKTRHQFRHVRRTRYCQREWINMATVEEKRQFRNKVFRITFRVEAISTIIGGYIGYNYFKNWEVGAVVGSLVPVAAFIVREVIRRLYPPTRVTMNIEGHWDKYGNPETYYNLHNRAEEIGGRSGL